MQRLLAVLRTEYLEKVRTRSFVLGTFLLPVFFSAVTILPSLLMTMGVEKSMSVAVVDSSGRLFADLKAELENDDATSADSSSVTTGSGRRSRRVDRTTFTLLEEPGRDRSREQLVSDLAARVDREELGSFLILPPDVVEGGKPAYYARNVSDFIRNDRIQRAIERVVRVQRLRGAALDPGLVESLLEPTRLETFKVGTGGEARKDQGATFGVAYALGLLFYICLLMYGAMMLRVVLEEKNSRSAEVMVSIVRPSELMGGKILAVALVALTQLSIWGLAVAVAASSGASFGGSFLSQLDLGSAGLSPSIGIYFIVFFLLGFFFYSGLYGSVGAMVSSETEAQQIQMPLMMPIIFAFILMFRAIRAPEDPLVRICSLVPFFSPLLMTVRICVQRPSPLEIGLSIVIMLVSIAGMLWLAGRIFRVGILMYGKRPNLPELLKWIRQS